MIVFFFDSVLKKAAITKFFLKEYTDDSQLK